MPELNNLKIQIFADGADSKEIEKLSNYSYIKGFTTNPTLMKEFGVTDYVKASIEILEIVKHKPVSFEVFTDNLKEMHTQATKISKLGNNVNVKIPISNSKGESSSDLLKELTKEGIKTNVTAIFTTEQIKEASEATIDSPYAILSIFAGRIADTGVDPEKLTAESVKIKNDINPKANILWASPREVFNIFQAERVGCEIITVAHSILNKLENLNKDLNQFSIETITMFYEDAKKAGYKI